MNAGHWFIKRIRKDLKLNPGVNGFKTTINNWDWNKLGTEER